MNTGAIQELQVELLTPASFAPFGDVIEAAAARRQVAINGGTTLRWHDIATIEAAGSGGRAILSLCRAQPRTLPFEVRMLERHPLGSQAFVPLSGTPFLVVVAAAPEATPRAFLARGQGVNYRRGVWHHPLLALERESDFLIADREGAEDNCEEVMLAQVWRIASLDGTDQA